VDTCVGGVSADEVVGGRGDSEGRTPVTAEGVPSVDEGKWDGATGDAIDGSCEPGSSSSVCDINQPAKKMEKISTGL
jgi:hypothetical protein